MTDCTIKEWIVSDRQMQLLVVIAKQMRGMLPLSCDLLAEMIIEAPPLSDELKKERERLYKIIESKCVEYHGVPIIYFHVIEDIFLRSEQP